jgi:hypothetical protein
MRSCKQKGAILNVFLSWSGVRSKSLAEALREYLPLVIQQAQPWFSPEDIDKGSRWLADLTEQLQKQGVAIVCITRESLSSPWMLFEAGALSKALDASWVCPVLLDVEPSDLGGPLAQFQSTRLTKEDIRRLLGTLNKRLDTPLADTQLDRLHDLLWPELDAKVKNILTETPNTTAPHRTPMDLIAEVLERVRGLERRFDELPVQTPVFYEWHGATKGLRLPNHRKALAEKVEHFKKLRSRTQHDLMTLEATASANISENERSELKLQIVNLRNKLIQYDVDINRHLIKLSRAQEYGK